MGTFTSKQDDKTTATSQREMVLNVGDFWMLKDANGTHFIDTDPFYFTWLAVKLHSRRDIHEGCPPSLAFYHSRFMAKTALGIAAQHGDEKSAAFRDFMAVMGPFIKTSAGGTGGDEVLRVRVGGGAVATTDATLADFQTLHDRFTKVVDYVRRIRVAPEAVISLPASRSPRELLYACEMYGLMEQVYLSMIGKPRSNIKCLFKSSQDGRNFEALLERVKNAQGGLLFVIDDQEHQHRLACHMDGALIPPTDPKSTLLTGCPVALYSISGAFKEEGITKITVPHNDQWVLVAGTEGAVEGDRGADKEASGGKLSIAYGRLWLGVGESAGEGEGGRRACDLHRCCQWLKKGELPDGKTYVGGFDEEDRATLASNQFFTASRLEVYQVWSTGPIAPIISPGDLQALVDMAADTPMTAQLLFKGGRDGWTYGSLFAKVGKAADLLFIIQDTSSHTFASHVKGQLKQPVDATEVRTTKCPVTFYSVSGAFKGDEGITKINIPDDVQYVSVAGPEGVVKGDKGGAGKVSIGEGRLWLGMANGAPAGDLRSCQQWITRDELPTDRTYRGSLEEEQDWATLAATLSFTCADLEVYTLQAPAGR
ncbi:unnamed protein product [Vitrella brassicaformis CCMP3155]|uniref:TLDc domain-containing protein n=1 Tax=Vitrella brassicaformis (strain CCMP3155) TaxID=1169540 RepID=A0A0G4EFG7_VITBC|nr:unnamed protein product [Vitrella brassicaformis CCMP3155]|eukprot:CEL94113.1 unnamed protein product [Vitrella brassicaformis CCMP3155]